MCIQHVAIKLPSRRELTLLVPLTKQQHELYKQYLCSLDNSTLEVVMREDTSESGPRSAAQSSANLTTSTTDAVLTNITVTSTTTANNNNNNNNSSSSSNALIPTITTTTAADSDWRKLMNLLLQLRKICNHTYLLPDVAPEPYEVTDDIVGGSGKLMVRTAIAFILDLLL